MRIGSLFSGIGGLELGLERAGVGETVWQVERDPFCREVLAKHWPSATRFEDVQMLPALIRSSRRRGVGVWRDGLHDVDLICGGFPCQDVSVAGKGAGLDGERSGLWSEFARIIRLVGPRYVVVENVTALLGRGFERVLRDLASSGYDAVWDCLPAQAVGAPHRRDRIFVVAWRVSDAERYGLRNLAERGRGRAQAADDGSAFSVALGEALAHGHGHGFEGERRGGILDGQRPAQRDNVDGCGGEEVANAKGERFGQGRPEPVAQGKAVFCGPGDWPPSPDDLHAWGRVQADAQPSVCRLADGLPDGLVRGRRGSLKAYGNAVVPAVAEVIGRVVLHLESICPDVPG